MIEEKRFLPIGTVVLLKGGKREIMITGYCIMPNGDVYDKSGKVNLKEGQIFDYGACLYPEGVQTSDQLFAFNHDQIAKICFRGYVTDDQKEMSEALNNALKTLEEADKAKAEERKLKEAQKEGQE